MPTTYNQDSTRYPVAPFLLDGQSYDLIVISLTRKFEVQDTTLSAQTLSGKMYRDIVGTFYNYEMVVCRANDSAKALSDYDAFFDAISSPDASHECEFLYGQETLVQEMYVTAGQQKMELLKGEKNGEHTAYWGEITLAFTAAEPSRKGGAPS